MLRTTRLICILFCLILVFVSPGCSGPDHEGAIRTRFTELTRHLIAGDADACVPLVDPLFVRAQGEGAVKIRIGFIAALFRLGNLAEGDVRVDQVELSEDKTKATVSYSLHDSSNDTWKVQQSSKWVLSEDNWYLAF